MSAPMLQGTTEPPIAYELREESLHQYKFLQADSMLKTSLDAPTGIHLVSPSAVDDGGTQSSSRNADENSAGSGRATD